MADLKFGHYTSRKDHKLAIGRRRSNFAKGNQVRDNRGMTADTAWIVKQAKTLGFDLCGVVRAERFPELEQYDEWLRRGYAGEMKYLEDPRRRGPELVMEDVRSVIVCALNYNTEHPYSTEAAAKAASDGVAHGWISRYAWGHDYHEVMWEKLNALVAAVKKERREPFAARAYSDTGPIAERVFAKHAGLGWLGKNTLLLNEELGSWIFLGVILTSLDLAPSLGSAESASPDFCGNCRQCLDACPTGALVEPYVLDARRCISYLTIELRGEIPVEFREAVGWQVYGCDICQDVCPFNRRAPETKVEDFQPRRLSRGMTRSHQERSPQRLQAGEDEPAAPEPGLRPNDAGVRSGEDLHGSLLMPGLEWLVGMMEEEFREHFSGSAIRRTKWRGLVRNACVALGNSGVYPGSEGYQQAVKRLRQLAGSEISTVAESARWALSRIEKRTG